MGCKRVGCETKWLMLKVISNAHWDDGVVLTIEPVHLYWKYVYLQLSYATDLEVEDQSINCGCLIQLE